FWRPNNDTWLLNMLDRIQMRPIIGFGVFAGFIAIIIAIFSQRRFFEIRTLNFPALQGVALILIVMFTCMILFYKWKDSSRPQLWRRVIAYGLGTLIGVEIIFQLVALAGVLPATTTVRDAIGPYDRIYYRAPDGSLTDDIANNYGWYAPDFRVDEEAHNVLLLGDAFVQGLQVPVEETMGVVLDQTLNGGQVAEEGETLPFEAMAVGHPDYGPGAYLWDLLFDLTANGYEADEVIILWDFSNDFQSNSDFNGEELFYYIEDGELLLDPRDLGNRHDNAHKALYGLDGFQPSRFIRSHLLFPQVIGDVIASPVSAAENQIPAPQDDISLPNSFVFYADQNDVTMEIAFKHLDPFIDYVNQNIEIPIRLVTIPVYPEEFYAQADPTDWTTQFGEADLFLPEEEMRAYAESRGISFLGLGEAMRASGLSTSDMQALYLDDGRGYFSSTGHAFVADALNQCFFAGTVGADAGCDLR
ncbi:MAG: hypothetical protein AAF633_11270, partial [Chloroflexota bacterium]